MSNLVSEGVFWLIDGQIMSNKVTFDPFDKNYYNDYTKDTFNLNKITHQNSWQLIKDFNDSDVDYDYYPRGAIYLVPEFTKFPINGNNPELLCFTVLVFIDKCLNDNEIKQLIYDYFNLNAIANYISRILWLPTDGKLSIVDFRCHNCKDK